jgi:hypothetical protein
MSAVPMPLSCCVGQVHRSCHAEDSGATQNWLEDGRGIPLAPPPGASARQIV